MWPPEAVSTIHRDNAEPSEEQSHEKDPWSIVMASIIGQRGVFSSRNYAAPVDALYDSEIRMTKKDIYFAKDRIMAEKVHLREQRIRTRELLRIRRARKLVADKRKLREDREASTSMLASYEQFKLEALKASDDTGAYTDSGDADTSLLLRDARLGTGSLRLAKNIGLEISATKRIQQRMHEKLEGAYARDHPAVPGA